MNFVFGFYSGLADFDPLNNPYVDIKAYKLTSNREISSSDDMSLRLCDEK